MGFVYNNTWEAFSKTYLELHGFFVTTNLFTALVPSEELFEIQEKRLRKRTDAKIDMRENKIEADILAYRIPHTKLGMYLQDTRSNDKNEEAGELFAGDPTIASGGGDKLQDLVYAEVRANLSLVGSEQQISSFFDDEDEGKKIARMKRLIAERYGIEPLIVIMAFSITESHKKEITNRGWRFKEFSKMWHFMKKRMSEDYVVKKSVLYNDPFLETFRFLERIGE